MIDHDFPCTWIASHNSFRKTKCRHEMQHHYHRKEALQTLLKNLKEAQDQFWTSSCKRDGRGGALLLYFFFFFIAMFLLLPAWDLQGFLVKGFLGLTSLGAELFLFQFSVMFCREKERDEVFGFQQNSTFLLECYSITSKKSPSPPPPHYWIFNNLVQRPPLVHQPMPIVAGKPNASHFFLSFFLSKCLILKLPIKQAMQNSLGVTVHCHCTEKRGLCVCRVTPCNALWSWVHSQNKSLVSWGGSRVCLALHFGNVVSLAHVPFIHCNAWCEPYDVNLIITLNIM